MENEGKKDVRWRKNRKNQGKHERVGRREEKEKRMQFRKKQHRRDGEKRRRRNQNKGREGGNE